MEKSQKILLISNIVLVGFVVAVIVHYTLGAYLKLPFPFNTFLFSPEIHFSDFIGIMPIANGLYPFDAPNPWRCYFPLAYILLFPFSLISNPLIAYFIFASVFLVSIVYMNIKNFTCANLTKLQNFQNIFIISILSYPILYILDRGNIDMFLFILLAGFVYLFKSKKYLLSAVLLGIQNAIKPFPIFFLILFLFKKKYKEFFLSILITGLLVIGGFMFLKGGFFEQITIFIKNLLIFKMNYVYNNSNSNAMSNTSSLFMAMKLLFCKYTTIFSTIQLEKVYSYLSLIITAITLFFTQKEKTFWKQITLLTLLMWLLPYVIDDYKLIFLFIPIWLFVSTQEKTKFDSAYAVLFGLLIIPKQFFVLFVHAHGMTQLMSFGIIINPILMLIFMGLIIYEQFSTSKNERLANGKI